MNGDLRSRLSTSLQLCRDIHREASRRRPLTGEQRERLEANYKEVSSLLVSVHGLARKDERIAEVHAPTALRLARGFRARWRP